MENPGLYGQLLERYRRLGVVTDDNSSCFLPDECPRCVTCWAGAEKRKPGRADAASQIAAPWVGAGYKQGGLLVVMQNMNDWGGIDLSAEPNIGMRAAGRAARIQLQQGCRRLFSDEGGKPYPGTNVWYRGIAYAGIWLEAAGDIASPLVWSSQSPDPPSLARVVDQIAITQQVKCSPLGERSDPTLAMWSECADFLLRDELVVLAPSRIVVLGEGLGLKRVLPLREEGCESVRLNRTTLSVKLHSARIDGARVDVLSVPFPSRPGGCANAHFKAALRLVSKLESTR